MDVKVKSIIGVTLIGVFLVLVGCSRALKAPDSQYDFQARGEGFIYGKLVLEDRKVTRIALEMKNAMTGKIKTYERDFTDHLYARREDDYALRIPEGMWDCVGITLLMDGVETRREVTALRFRVEESRGSYLGTWVFPAKSGIKIEDDKAVQDGKIAEAYPRLNLNFTLQSLPAKGSEQVRR